MTPGHLTVLSLSAAMLAAAAMAASAQEEPQLPPINYQDPAAVAQAYLDACSKRDVKAAVRALDPKTEARDLNYSMKDMPTDFNLDQLLTEILLLPIFHNLKYVMGQPAMTGNECRIPVTAIVTIPQTLVLRKGPDGKWRVALRESILNSTGANETEVFKSAAQVEQVDCMSNIKQLCLAFLMWAQDHNDTLPPADKWSDEIYVYTKNRELFKCPAAPDLACGYAYNTAVAGKKLADIADPARTVMIFESTTGKLNAADAMQSLPQPGRHNGGNNFGFVDGHVRWVPDGANPQP